ncbi:MAG: D-alanyl-D-alanine carboxypeptidase/D-alanyl-D-alanine endopeptidase [Phycisphaerales bacterium]
MTPHLPVAPLSSRRRPALAGRILTTVVAAMATAAFDGTSVAASLESDLRSLVGGAGLGKAKVSVSVREVDDDRALAAIVADRPMLPASNMKLLTTGAALETLGPAFRFSTRLGLDRPAARLVVLGDGDPGFGDPELLDSTIHRRPDGSAAEGLDVEALLAIWADAVANSSPGRIDELVVDDRIFDRDRVHPLWPDDQLNRHYCAEVAGINFHGNCLHLRPSPIGGRAVPGPFSPDAPWLALENRATGRSGSKPGQTVWIGHGSRTHGGDGLTLFGNLAATPEEPLRVTARDPALFFGRLLADRLERRGIEVGRVRVAEDGDRFDALVVVAPPVETPLETSLARANVDSSNLHAEALLKRIVHAETGAPGSWTAADPLVRAPLGDRTYRRLLEGVVVSDGSGLSRGNRVRADLMTAYLASMARDPALGDPFRASLAVGGETGTLAKRFRNADLRGCRVLAKSGYIRGVSCLSGFVVAPDGRSLAFSVLCNDVASVQNAKRLQERIVERLARELTTSNVG